MLAFYRKYRPKSFSELVGQEQVSGILRNAGRRDKLAHAYILYGPRGTGKTTAARLIAKLAQCLSQDMVRRDGEPCNACAACADIDAGRAMDVIEIDAASNRGIDEIRDLRESIRVSPAVYAYKVFIVDEVHMLTTAAWNALLKTLEEPPAKTILILATTEYEKIPPTIASRAQRFHFRKIPLSVIIAKLKEIVALEKIEISDDALELIAAAADGGLRDAESLLDQVTSNGGAIDAATVEATVGKAGIRRVMAFANAIAERDIAAALRQVADMTATGGNVADLNRELILYLRRALALRFDPTLKEIFADELTKEELAATVAHSAILDPAKTIPLMKGLIRAYSEMRYSPFPHVPLEVALIEHLGGK